MYDQTAITIARGTDSHEFAHVLQITLERLQREQWESRIFQFGHEGVMIVAHRVNPTEISSQELEPWQVPDELLPVSERFDWGTEFDLLDPVARSALDRIFDVLGPVPDDLLLDALELAVPIALAHDTPRTLEHVAEHLREYYEVHLANLDEAEDHTYAQTILAVVGLVQELFAHRVN